MADFTPTQGCYLAFIHAYTALHGCPPAEPEIAAAMCVSPSSVNQMATTLEELGLILRHSGQHRSLQVLVPEDEIPPWNRRKSAKHPVRPGNPLRRAVAPRVNLYVLPVFLTSGTAGAMFANKEVRRDIEIRGDQTLERLHQAIFAAFDHSDERLYGFHFGRRPCDPDGPNYGIAGPPERTKGERDARTTTLGALGLKPNRVFGYLFDYRRR